MYSSKLTGGLSSENPIQSAKDFLYTYDCDEWIAQGIGKKLALASQYDRDKSRFSDDQITMFRRHGCFELEKEIATKEIIEEEKLIKEAEKRKESQFLLKEKLREAQRQAKMIWEKKQEKLEQEEERKLRGLEEEIIRLPIEEQIQPKRFLEQMRKVLEEEGEEQKLLTLEEEILKMPVEQQQQAQMFLEKERKVLEEKKEEKLLTLDEYELMLTRAEAKVSPIVSPPTAIPIPGVTAEIQKPIQMMPLLESPKLEIQKPIPIPEEEEEGTFIEKEEEKVKPVPFLPQPFLPQPSPPPKPSPEPISKAKELMAREESYLFKKLGEFERKSALKDKKYMALCHGKTHKKKLIDKYTNKTVYVDKDPTTKPDFNWDFMKDQTENEMIPRNYFEEVLLISCPWAIFMNINFNIYSIFMRNMNYIIQNEGYLIINNILKIKDEKFDFDKLNEEMENYGFKFVKTESDKRLYIPYHNWRIAVYKKVKDIREEISVQSTSVQSTSKKRLAERKKELEEKKLRWRGQKEYFECQKYHKNTQGCIDTKVCEWKPKPDRCVPICRHLNSGNCTNTSLTYGHCVWDKQSSPNKCRGANPLEDMILLIYNKIQELNLIIKSLNRMSQLSDNLKEHIEHRLYEIDQLYNRVYMNLEEAIKRAKSKDLKTRYDSYHKIIQSYKRVIDKMVEKIKKIIEEK